MTFGQFLFICLIDNYWLNVNMSIMIKTENNILNAAMRMFSRYGVKRTSMADLAQEAGISRQTLYNAYKNKDEVLRALIRAFASAALADSTKALRNVHDLGGQLDIVLHNLTVTGFDLVAQMPNAQDLIDGFNASGKAEMDAAAETFRLLIADLLKPHHAALARNGLDADALADFVQHAAKAMGRTARDRAHLLQQLHSLRQLCLAATAA